MLEFALGIIFGVLIGYLVADFTAKQQSKRQKQLLKLQQEEAKYYIPQHVKDWIDEKGMM